MRKWGAITLAGLFAGLVMAMPAQAASGLWERTWGEDVIQTGMAGDLGAVFEICTVATDCQAGATTAPAPGGELNLPSGAAADSSGNVYVADQEHHRIQKFDSSGNFLLTWGKDVDGVAVGTGLEVCTVAANCKTGVSGGLGGEMNYPTGVATDSSGNVYVTDKINNRIQRFSSTGVWDRAWGKDVDGVVAGTGFEVCTVAANCKTGVSGGLGGEMQDPDGIATDSSANVYVADQSNHRIQKFSSTGIWNRAWGEDVIQTGMAGDLGTVFEICTVAANCKIGITTAPALGGEFFFPIGVGTDSANNVYVGDSSHDRVQKFDSSGAFQRAWGRNVDTAAGAGFEICTVAVNCKVGAAGGLGGEMAAPFHIDTDGAGNVYVVETGGNRIQVFDASGGWQRAWGRDVIQTGMPGDLGAAFEICTVAADCQSGSLGTLGGEMSSPNGLTADASGNVYVTDNANYRVQKFADPVPPPPPPAGGGITPIVTPATPTTAPKKCKKGQKLKKGKCVKKKRKRRR